MISWVWDRRRKTGRGTTGAEHVAKSESLFQIGHCGVAYSVTQQAIGVQVVERKKVVILAPGGIEIEIATIWIQWIYDRLGDPSVFLEIVSQHWVVLCLHVN